MQAIQCLTCKKPFDEVKHIPKKLDCGCLQCKQCLLAQMKTSQQLKCKIHKQVTQKGINQLPTVHMNIKAELDLQTDVKISQCKQHKKEIFAFCKNDNTLVCNDCVVGVHSGHQFQGLQQKLQELNQQIESRIQKFSQSAQLKEKQSTYQNKIQSSYKQMIAYQKTVSGIIKYFMKIIVKICDEELSQQLKEIIIYQSKLSKVQCEFQNILKRI